MQARPLVDVAVSVYGKPYQTAVTLLSLMRYSGQWIDKIYITEERKQPNGSDLTLLHQLLRDYNTVYYTPRFFLWYEDITKSYKRHLLSLPAFRHAVRYQYAWEKTDKSYLLLTHNDVLYRDDIVGAYLERIGDAVGIGKVGQCWNCPAYKAQKCWGGMYDQYQPDYAEIEQLYQTYGNVRKTPFQKIICADHSWPLPECRLNEFTALINMPLARRVTMPYGPAYPLGITDGVDTGTKWFRQISEMGLRATNFEYDPYAQHGWASAVSSGHQSLFDKSMYDAEEERAYQVLQNEYGLGTPALAYGKTVS